MSPRLLLLATILTLAAGCDRQRPPPERLHRLVGQVIATGDYLDQPGRLAVVGDRLVVLDRSAPMIHVFGLPGANRLGSFGQKGEGPGEFRSAREIQADPGDAQTFWVFDGQLSRLTHLRFGGSDARPSTAEVVNLHGEGGLHFQAVWLNDSTLASTGIYPAHPAARLLMLNRRGQVTGAIGSFPRHPNGPAIPASVLQHAYEGRMAVRPDRTALAFATRHADVLEIYRADGTLVRGTIGSTGFLPVFEVSGRAEGASMATGDDLRVGYLDLAATNDLLFALFSGHTRAEARPRTYFGKEVHVFTWSGDRIATLALDERAFSIAVDPLGEHLYAVHHDPEPNVARYPLPQTLRRQVN